MSKMLRITECLDVVGDRKHGCPFAYETEDENYQDYAECLHPDKMEMVITDYSKTTHPDCPLDDAPEKEYGDE